MKIQILKVGAKSGQIVADNGIISRMVAAYNPQQHEAPLFIGKGGTATPAVGWVSYLSRDNDALYAEVKQIPQQIEKELKTGRRRVENAGFYADYGLRHVRITGQPIFIPGLKAQFKESGDYFEFQQGGYGMGLDNDPRMKAFLRLGDEIMCNRQQQEFAEGDNPGEALHKKAMDVMLNATAFSEGGDASPKNITYQEAFHDACQQNPDLTARYIAQLEETRKRNMKPALFR